MSTVDVKIDLASHRSTVHLARLDCWKCEELWATCIVTFQRRCAISWYLLRYGRPIHEEDLCRRAEVVHGKDDQADRVRFRQCPRERMLLKHDPSRSLVIWKETDSKDKKIRGFGRELQAATIDEAGLPLEYERGIFLVGSVQST